MECWDSGSFLVLYEKRLYTKGWMTKNNVIERRESRGTAKERVGIGYLGAS